MELKTLTSIASILILTSNAYCLDEFLEIATTSDIPVAVATPTATETAVASPNALRECIDLHSRNTSECIIYLSKDGKGRESIEYQTCVSWLNYNIWKCQCEFASPFDIPEDCFSRCGEKIRMANRIYESYYYACLAARQGNRQQCANTAERESHRNDIVNDCLNPPPPPLEVFY